MASTIRGVDNFDSLIHQGIGVNQTWQDVTTSRADNTTYTNNTGKPILVAVTGYSSSGGAVYLACYVDGVRFMESNAERSSGSVFPSATFIIPDGSTYKVDVTTSFRSWWELR